MQPAELHISYSAEQGSAGGVGRQSPGTGVSTPASGEAGYAAAGMQAGLGGERRSEPTQQCAPADPALRHSVDVFGTDPCPCFGRHQPAFGHLLVIRYPCIAPSCCTGWSDVVMSEHNSMPRYCQAFARGMTQC